MVTQTDWLINGMNCNLHFMDETKFTWDDLRLFLAVARHRGLSAAARETGTSAPTLGRRMRSLEAISRKELFHRHARGYELTETGEAFFQKSVEVEAHIMPLIAPWHEEGRTLVKVSAGAWTIHALCQQIEAIVGASPNALLRFISADQYLNINHREAVIGIRNQRPHQAGLACRKIGEVSFAGYAVDPAVTSWVKVSANTPSARWLASQDDAQIAVEVNSSQSARDLAVNGMGRVVLPCFIGDQEASLTKVTADISELAHEQWIVSHHEDRFIPAVRQVLDSIYGVLRHLHGAGRVP